jgi:hypothetical protein
MVMTILGAPTAPALSPEATALIRKTAGEIAALTTSRLGMDSEMHLVLTAFYAGGVIYANSKFGADRAAQADHLIYMINEQVARMSKDEIEIDRTTDRVGIAALTEGERATSLLRTNSEQSPQLIAAAHRLAKMNGSPPGCIRLAIARAAVLMMTMADMMDMEDVSFDGVRVAGAELIVEPFTMADVLSVFDAGLEKGA